MRQYLHCIKHIKGKKIQCKKVFLNYNIDAIDDIDASIEYVFVGHANWKIIKLDPPILDKRITRFIGVSEFACEMLEKWAKEHGRIIKAERAYDPLTLEPKEKVVIVVFAGRLNDRVKGGDRTIRFIEAMDRYVDKHRDKHWLGLIFSNPVKLKTKSPNIAIMPPRVDVRPYLQIATYVRTIFR